MIQLVGNRRATMTITRQRMMMTQIKPFENFRSFSLLNEVIVVGNAQYMI
jgi:hypothetical protein